MDREKVIKGLENCAMGFDCPPECPYLDYCNDLTKPMFVELAKDALALLKEQEAVKPLPQNSNGWVRTIKLWYCGACHSKISRRTSKYCPNCGKPILWEGR